MSAVANPGQPAAGSSGDWQLNNFDLIRLLAALQVAAVHVIADLKPAGLGVAILDAGLRLFPGVPIFFLISGALISRSYEHSGSLIDYYRNRCLRIFPGLWVCLLASTGVILLELDTLGSISSASWLLWWLGQMTLGQQYSADFLQGMRLNGSLWTIPVELEFYLLLPLVYRALGLGVRRGNLVLVSITALSAATHALLLRVPPDTVAPYWSVLETFMVIPCLWMFFAGVLIQRNWELLRPWLAGRALWWLLGYALISSAARQYLHLGVGSFDISPLFLVPLAGVVMSCATSARQLATRLLAGNDISYGVYIYHMPVIATMLHFGLANDLRIAMAAIAATVLLGCLSWSCIERPFLRQKHAALRPTGRTGLTLFDPPGIGRLRRSTG